MKFQWMKKHFHSQSMIDPWPLLNVWSWNSRVQVLYHPYRIFLSPNNGVGGTASSNHSSVRLSHFWSFCIFFSNQLIGLTQNLVVAFNMELFWRIHFFVIHKIDRLMQERCKSIANALELHLSCTNPSNYPPWFASHTADLIPSGEGGHVSIDVLLNW